VKHIPCYVLYLLLYTRSLNHDIISKKKSNVVHQKLIVLSKLDFYFKAAEKQYDLILSQQQFEVIIYNLVY